MSDSSGAAYSAKTNTLAIVSLVTSIVGLSLIGIITGHISMSQIKKTGEQGRGLAIAGLVIGYVGIALGIIGVMVFVASGLFIAGLDYSTM